MIKPVSSIRLISAAVGGGVAITGILIFLNDYNILEESSKSSIRNFLRHSFSIKTVPFILIIAFILLFLFNYLYTIIYDYHAKVHEWQAKYTTISNRLKKSERLRMTDVITGIPNQEQFFIDLPKFAEDSPYDSPFHLTFIDLLSFGEVNKKYGYPTGDRIIEYFAQSVYKTMRRDETIYKMPFDEQYQGAELWQRAYRKYTGGDEFLFLIRGSEADAIGFLVRLQNRIRSELTPHIQSELLNDTDWSLSFSAAVIPVYQNDTKENVLQRAHEGMRAARQPGSSCRVFWTCKTAPHDMKDGWQRKAYESALELFGNNRG